MNQNTIHPADCRCSRCPGNRSQSAASMRLAVGLYVLGAVIAGTALITATVSS